MRKRGTLTRHALLRLCIAGRERALAQEPVNSRDGREIAKELEHYKQILEGLPPEEAPACEGSPLP